MVLTAVSLFAATLSGAHGQNVAAILSADRAAAAAVGSAARSQGVPSSAAKAAYRRAPYAKPALKYLFALGWIGGKKNWVQCRLMLVNEDAAVRQAEQDLRERPKLVAQLRKRAVSVRDAAVALVKGAVSACS